MNRKAIELVISIGVALFGAGSFGVAITGDPHVLTVGRIFLGCIGLGAIAVGIGLFLNWLDHWIY